MKQLILILFLFPIFLSAHTIKGKVVRVSDGDTVVVLDSTNTQHKIRLDAIDAPEKGQDFGNRSKQYLSDLIAGKVVSVEWTKKDMYKRILGTIYIGHVNVNEEMVRSGMAWRYKYNNSKHLLELQEDAQANKRGLWSMKNPIDPWQFRKDKKKKK